MIYQLHSEHGQHIAYNTLEENYNIKNGWVTVDEDEFYGLKPPEIDLDLGKELPDKLALAYEHKFGKKPHHLMKPETIQAKLDEVN